MPLPRPIRTWKESAQRGDTLSRSSSAQPLQAWQLAFLEWLANQERHPPVSKQVEKANELRAETSVEGSPLTARRLRAFKTRKGAVEFWEKLQKGTLARCRAKIENNLDEYVAAHKCGLDWALGAKDYRAIPAFADPMLERVWPRKEIVQANTQVNIVLSAQQQRAIASVDDEDVTIDAQLIDAEPDDG